jgi:hypothetical protein
VRLHKTDYQNKTRGTEEFGFTISSDSPVMINHVDINSVADVSREYKNNDENIVT